MTIKESMDLIGCDNILLQQQFNCCSLLHFANCGLSKTNY